MNQRSPPGKLGLLGFLKIMESLRLLEQRFSPITRFGEGIPQESVGRHVPYDGTLLPGFILRNGGNHRAVWGFLRANRIGSVFDDLEDGRDVMIPNATRAIAQGNLRYNYNAFARHPEA